MSKTALITGASMGIGKELAEIHASRGGHLVLVARSRDKLETLKIALEKKYAIQATIIIKDLSDSASHKEVYEEVKKANIEVDYLINNAGFGYVGMFHESEWERLSQMINLNILALTSLTHLFLPDFVKRNKGKILNVSSTASLLPGPLQAVYFASKAYVTSFTNAIAEEVRNTNITVTNLMPGATETKFGATSGMDKTDMFKKTASAYKVALDGYEGMIKGKLDVISGLTTLQKMLFLALPFTPKKIVLNQIKTMQTVKK